MWEWDGTEWVIPATGLRLSQTKDFFDWRTLKDASKVKDRIQARIEARLRAEKTAEAETVADTKTGTVADHYYHCYSDGQWKKPVEEHKRALMKSGLWDRVNKYVGIVGSPDQRAAVKNALGSDWTVVVEADSGWEQLTLNVLDLSGELPIIYTHSKGSAFPSYASDEWRQEMELYVILGWREAIRILNEGYVAVGIRWWPANTPGAAQHFSGNYWIATPEYLRTLGTPLYNTRWDAEMWIGNGFGRKKDGRKVFDLQAKQEYLL